MRLSADGGVLDPEQPGLRAAQVAAQPGLGAQRAENYERMEDAYLSALADEAKTDTEAPLSTAELIKELGLA